MFVSQSILRTLVALTLHATVLSWAVAPFGNKNLQLQLQHQLGQNPQDTPRCDSTDVTKPGDDCNRDSLINISPHIRYKDREGFYFENPSTDCIFVTQMYIWDSFKDLEKDTSKLFKLVHKDGNFTVIGNHPIAGHYKDLLHFYVNALRRLGVLFMDHADKFEVHPRAIHGGCNQRWSTQEIQFKGVMDSGGPFDIMTAWTTRWHRGQMVEIRVYVDSTPIIDLLCKNEDWKNGATFHDNVNYRPGPAGMPNMKELEGLLSYPDGSKYED